MAVKEANSNYKSFTFNGVSAADYGVYVTDVNVFNSAERAVEYITIPGRNGSFALDHGRFENIIVEYECALGQDTDVDFATAISDFRNALAAAKGYQRLEDDMNPDEYRMAVFSKGLEAPTLNQQTATFKVEFNCKPQRYLKSGETAVSVASGDTISNPTLYDASPILQVWGYGDIGINDDTITIADDVIGNVQIAQPLPGYNTYPFSQTWAYSVSQFRADDVLTLGKTKADINLLFTDPQNVDRDSTRVQTTSQLESASIGWYSTTGTNWCRGISVSVNIVPQNYGAKTTGVIRIPVTLYVGIFETFGDTGTYVTNLEIQINYRTVDNTMDISFGVSILSQEGDATFNSPYGGTTFAGITGYSTKSALGEPLYFDLDVGEAYKIEDGQAISVNNAVSFPAKLPVLKPGANTITFENTVDQLKLVPRWWKV